MEEKITLEKDVFKALASDTRIAILKILDKRRHTQSELAVTLKLSVPTVKEHLNKAELSIIWKTRACGIPQAWYGAGLLSLWSKGRVGSIPTPRAISEFS